MRMATFWNRLSNILCQRGAAIGGALKAREKILRQRVVPLQSVHQHAVGGGNISVSRGRDVFKRGDRLVKKTGQRAPAIQIIAGASCERDIQNRIASISVVPWKPAQNRMDLILSIQNELFRHDGIDAHHAMGVDDGFGHACGSGCEEIFGDRVPMKGFLTRLHFVFAPALQKGVVGENLRACGSGHRDDMNICEVKGHSARGHSAHNLPQR